MLLANFLKESANDLMISISTFFLLPLLLERWDTDMLSGWSVDLLASCGEPVLKEPLPSNVILRWIHKWLAII